MAKKKIIIFQFDETIHRLSTLSKRDEQRANEWQS